MFQVIWILIFIFIVNLLHLQSWLSIHFFMYRRSFWWSWIALCFLLLELCRSKPLICRNTISSNTISIVTTLRLIFRVHFTFTFLTLHFLYRSCFIFGLFKCLVIITFWNFECILLFIGQIRISLTLNIFIWWNPIFGS